MAGASNTAIVPCEQSKPCNHDASNSRPTVTIYALLIATVRIRTATPTHQASNPHVRCSIISETTETIQTATTTHTNGLSRWYPPVFPDCSIAINTDAASISMDAKNKTRQTQGSVTSSWSICSTLHRKPASDGGRHCRNVDGNSNCSYRSPY